MSDTLVPKGMIAGRVENINGLTWKEWVAAAGVEMKIASFDECNEEQLSTYHTAWMAGEDPSDYRACDKSEVS